MPNKPVVFIPGYIATKLKFRPENWTLFPPSLGDLASAERKKRLVELLAAPKFNDPNDDVIPTEPIRNVLGISKQADALYGILDNLGYDTTPGSPNFRAVGWDWRKGVDDVVTQEAVTKAIQDLFTSTGKKVVLLPHSTGGLVMRKLLEAKPELTKMIDEVISFGIPWCGTLAAMHGITDPGKVGIGPLALKAEDIRAITSHAQATYDLCPLNPLTSDMTDVNLFIENGQQAGPLVRTAWLAEQYMLDLADRANQRLGTQQPTIQLGGRFKMPPVTNVVGWGFKTLGQGDLLPDGKVQYSDSPFLLGDGTVPLVSAAWLRGPNVRTMFLPIGAYPTGNIPMRHSRIWDSPPVAQLLTEVLQNAPRRPFIAAAVDGDDFQSPRRKTVKIRISATDENGQLLPKAVAKFKFGAGNNPTVKMDMVRKDVELPRQGLTANVNGTTFFRLPVEVKWDDGKAEVVTIFHVA